MRRRKILKPAKRGAGRESSTFCNFGKQYQKQAVPLTTGSRRPCRRNGREKTVTEKSGGTNKSATLIGDNPRGAHKEEEKP